MLDQTIQKLYACRKKETEFLIEILAHLIEKIEEGSSITIDTTATELLLVKKYEKRIADLERKIESLQKILGNDN